MRYPDPAAVPPMLARRQSPMLTAFDSVFHETRQLATHLAVLKWTLANDPDESTESVAVQPRSLDRADRRVS